MKMEKVIWIFLLFVSSINYGLDYWDLQEWMGESLINNVKNGKIEQVEKLLENGVSPNFQDDQGKTALMYAAEKGYMDTVKLLLDYGALIFLKDKQGETSGEKVFKKIPTNWVELCDLQNEFFDISRAASMFLIFLQ